MDKEVFITRFYDACVDLGLSPTSTYQELIDEANRQQELDGRAPIDVLIESYRCPSYIIDVCMAWHQTTRGSSFWEMMQKKLLQQEDLIDSTGYY